MLPPTQTDERFTFFMPINFTQRLSFTLVRTCIIVVLLAGTSIALLRVYIDYNDQKSLIEKRMGQILSAGALPATRAAYQLDRPLAQEVVNGLKQYDFLHHIAIFDDAGDIMAIHEYPITRSETSWLTQLLVGPSTDYTQVLRNNDQNFGRLELKLNNDLALQETYRHSLYTFCSGLMFTIFLALLFTYIYNKYLTRPLSRIANNFIALNQAGIPQSRLPEIKGHENNELGKIIHSANDLLSIIEKREMSLEQSETQLRLILNSSPNQVFSLNTEGEFVFLNTATASFYKQTVKQLEGKKFRDIHKGISEKEACLFLQHIEAAKAQNCKDYASKITMKDAEGMQHVQHISLTPYRHDQHDCILVIANDVTDRIEAENQIERLSYFDTLTQLPNRHQIQERLQDDIQSSLANNTYGALLFIDIDDFKRINDSFGHSAGDALLLKLSNRMQTQIRKSETLARLGGDEFILSVPNIASDRSKAESLASNLSERILSNIRKPLRIGEHQLEVSASIGITLYSGENRDIDKLLSAADTAMYQAKGQGRDRFLVFNSAMSEEASRLVTLESDIRKAIGEQQFVFFLQPLLDGRTRKMVSAEALLRWIHPERGQVLPGQFIDYLENSPMINKVGKMILDKVCAFIRSCRERGIMDLNTRIAVNISAREFHQPHFVKMVVDVLDKYELQGNCLELEITEGAALKHLEESKEKMQQLKTLGIKFALDDFGTGYSSLSYLKQLPVDKIKIDKSFIKDITYDPQDAMLVSAIIAIADTLGLEVVAEGVETEDQADWLYRHGQVQFQGFLFDKALPQAEFENHYLNEHLILPSK